MSTAPTAAQKLQGIQAPFQPFTLELGDCNAPGDMVNRRNRIISIASIGLKLRGRFSFGNLRGRAVGPLAGMPDIPGLFIEVKPEGRRVRIFDPFIPEEKAPGEEDYKAILADANAILQNIPGGGKFATFPTSQPKLDDHNFKTFIRELIERHKIGDIYRLHVGVMPKMEQVDALQGEYMCNFNHSGQVPKFEKENEDYLKNLLRLGMI